jgi:branched-chain amino acid transport system substrate-binding protein
MRRRSAIWSLVWAAVMVSAAACGSRLSSDEIRAAGQGEAVGSGAHTRAASVAGETSDPVGAAAPGTSGPAGSAATAPPAAEESSRPAAAAAASAARAPIVIGIVGYFSGVGGGGLSGARDAWVAWSKSVNAKGGINGHPVQLLVGDDGGNAARSVTITRDFVENKGAIAISWVSIGMPIREYVESRSVPVIGSNPSTVEWNQSPMLFTPFSAGDGLQWGTANAMKSTGRSKVAFLYCVEVSDCGQSFGRSARAAGLQVVHESQYSVTQPSFTAECLQMKNAGAEMVMLLGDNNSLLRAARDCGRQGLRPTWVTPVTDDAMASVPELDGALAVSPVFPWFARSGSPGIEEYARAIQRYAPQRLTRGQGVQAWAWVSAKTFERAAAQMAGAPSSRDLLEGLWRMNGETLDGLTPGRAAVTFTRGRPSRDPFCVFEMRVQHGAWTSRDLAPVCR